MDGQLKSEDSQLITVSQDGQLNFKNSQLSQDRQLKSENMQKNLRASSCHLRTGS